MCSRTQTLWMWISSAQKRQNTSNTKQIDENKIKKTKMLERARAAQETEECQRQHRNQQLVNNAFLLLLRPCVAHTHNHSHIYWFILRFEQRNQRMKTKNHRKEEEEERFLVHEIIYTKCSARWTVLALLFRTFLHSSHMCVCFLLFRTIFFSFTAES